jgi:phosphoenolpyruvate carboxylase
MRISLISTVMSTSVVIIERLIGRHKERLRVFLRSEKPANNYGGKIKIMFV